MSDIALVASIDFTKGKNDVDEFCSYVEKRYEQTARKTEKSFSDIQKAVANREASAPGRRTGGGSSPTDYMRTFQSAFAQERALQAAQNRALGMNLRIQRQLGGNEALYRRVTAALDSYTTSLKAHGTRSLEGAKAQGAFAKEMTRVNSVIAESGGLLPVLNRGFGSMSGELRNLTGLLGGTAGQFTSVAASAGTSARAIGGVALAAGALVAVPLTVAAITVAVLAMGAAMAEVTDRMNLMRGRFEAATGSVATANQMMQDTYEIAKRTGISMDTVGVAVGRFASATQDLGLSSKEVTRLSETFIKLGRVAGLSSAETSSALIQTSQAIQAGAAMGEEWASIAENFGPLARQIARDMGMPVGSLKKLASEGKITADVIITALQSMADSADADFARLGSSVEQISSRISTEWDKLLSTLDEKLALSEVFKFFMTLPLRALEAANRMLSAPAPVDRAKELETAIAEKDRLISKTPFEWARNGLRNQRAELVTELDKIRTGMVRSAVETGEATIAAENKAWENRVDAAKRGAQEIIEANDPVAKAQAKFAADLKKLDASKMFLSTKEYGDALSAITKTRDDAIERANKHSQSLSREERAIQQATKTLNKHLSELDHDIVTTERLTTARLTSEEAFRKVTDAIEIETQLRKLQQESQEAGIKLDEREAKAKLQTLESLNQFTDAVAFSRNLVAEFATPAEKTAARLAELQRNYDLLKNSGQKIPQDIETAYARAKDAATSANDYMKQIFTPMFEQTSDEEADTMLLRIIIEVIS